MGDPAINRRSFLRGGAGVTVGAAVAGVALGSAATVAADQLSATGGAAPDPRSEQVAFHGAHQAGVDTPAQTHAVFVGWDLRPATTRSDAARLMRLWSDDARRLTAGQGALADNEPELASGPARLTVTFGLGPTFFPRLDLAGELPDGFADLPSFRTDRLDPRWCGGDVVIQVCGDDQLVVSHCLRMLLKDGRAFATVRWIQRGFRHTPGPGEPAPRNLMGQLDGIVNPAPGTPDFDDVVWAGDGPAWVHGGSTMVLRRIAMNLDTWDELGRSAREQVIGRRVADGAPLSGGGPRATPDLQARNEFGLTLVPEFAHIARAAPRQPQERFLRRPYSYDESPGTGAVSDVGLLFVAYLADLQRQFIPVQERLAELDLLNQWTSAIGSAVFLLPPGCQESGWIGETLLG